MYVIVNRNLFSCQPEATTRVLVIRSRDGNHRAFRERDQTRVNQIYQATDNWIVQKSVKKVILFQHKATIESDRIGKARRTQGGISTWLSLRLIIDPRQLYYEENSNKRRSDSDEADKDDIIPRLQSVISTCDMLQLIG